VNYPLQFRPNAKINLYTPGGALIIANVVTQVFKPLLATSSNTYTQGATTIWAPGSTILRVVCEAIGLDWDHPGATGWYMVFQPDFAAVKWRVVSGYNWQDAVGPNMAFAYLGAF